MNKKNLFKLALIIPAMAGLFLMASMPASTSGTTATVQQDDKKGVYVENDVFDFGTISRNGERVSFDFIIRNNSDSPIGLITVNTSCGCTTSDWSKEPVGKGKTTTIRVVFDPKGQFGPINKKVTATLDTGQKLVMVVKGTVE
jgi:Protein of unknown function (DUF1573).